MQLHGFISMKMPKPGRGENKQFIPFEVVNDAAKLVGGLSAQARTNGCPFHILQCGMSAESELNKLAQQHAGQGPSLSIIDLIKITEVLAPRSSELYDFPQSHSRGMDAWRRVLHLPLPRAGGKAHEAECDVDQMLYMLQLCLNEGRYMVEQQRLRV